MFNYENMESFFQFGMGMTELKKEKTYKGNGRMLTLGTIPNL